MYGLRLAGGGGGVEKPFICRSFDLIVCGDAE